MGDTIWARYGREGDTNLFYFFSFIFSILFELVRTCCIIYTLFDKSISRAGRREQFTMAKKETTKTTSTTEITTSATLKATTPAAPVSTPAKGKGKGEGKGEGKSTSTSAPALTIEQIVADDKKRAQYVDALLKKLADEKTGKIDRKKIRSFLRRLGHRGGLRNSTYSKTSSIHDYVN